MKNIKYYMFLAATMMFTGCSQDDLLMDAPAPGTQGDVVEITIGAPQEHDSRVSYDDSAAPFAWENGDSIITVGFAADGSYKGQEVFHMKNKLSGDKKTATFTGALPEGATNYKVYYKSANLTISTTDGAPKVDYSSQSEDVSSAETETAHMKNFYQLATPQLTLQKLLDPTVGKNLKMENSLLRLDVKSYPEGIGTLKSILMRTNIANGAAQVSPFSISNVSAEQKGFKAFMLFDPSVMAQTAGETFEVVFVGEKGAQAISKDNTKATFDKAGNRYNLIAYQNDAEIQGATTKAVLNNWAEWNGATVDASTHTITTKWSGFITAEMVTEAMGPGEKRSLIVSGPINGHDIKFIREAAGSRFDNTFVPEELVKAPLRHLDLSGVTIKASDDVYAHDNTMGDYKSEENKITSRMFNTSALESIKLPEGITEIGNDAFSTNFILKEVNIPSTVTTLGHGAFAQNENLAAIEIPDKVTSVGNNLFELCKKLQTVKLSENCSVMSPSMFARCSSLKTITIPACVKRIASDVFKETILDSLVFPANVEFVGANMFNGVTTLKNLTFENPSTELVNTFAGFTASENCVLNLPAEWKYRVDENNGKPMFEKLTWKAIHFSGEDVLVDVDKVNHTITTQSAGNIVPEMIAVALGSTDTLIIKGEINGLDIKAIREAAGCQYKNTQGSGLNNVALKHLDLSGATIKASEDFYANDKYKTEDNKIGDYMFVYSGLRSVVLPEGITEIGALSFKDSRYLASINIPTTVTTLKKAAFMGAVALKGIEIPNSVVTVENSVFAGCSQLDSAKLSEKMTEIPSQMFYQSGLTSITIPASVKNIYGWAFRESKLDSLVIPATVDYVDEYLLGNMNTLRTLTFEGENTTYNTKELHHIFKGYADSKNCDLIIPAAWKFKVSETEDGQHMFEGLAWKSITLTGAEAELPEGVDPVTHTITTKAAGTITPEYIELALGSGNKLIVKGDINGADIKAIREAAGCPFSVNDGTTQNTKLYDLDLSGAVIKASNDIYGQINENAQYRTTGNKLNKMMFKYSVLRSLKIPENITEIETGALAECRYLSSFEIPASVKTLGAIAFSGNAFTNFVVPNTVTSIGNGLFSSCGKLTSVKLSENITKIPSQIFMNTPIAALEIPASVTTIENDIFMFDKYAHGVKPQLSSLVIPATVKSIGTQLLKGINTLRTLKFESAAVKFNTDKEGVNRTFRGYTDSENCDLVIPAEWKSKVSTGADGKHMFEGLAWKSIKTLTGEVL